MNIENLKLSKELFSATMGTLPTYKSDLNPDYGKVGKKGLFQMPGASTNIINFAPRDSFIVYYFDLDQVDAKLVKFMDNQKKEFKIHDCQPRCAEIHPVYKNFQKKIQGKKMLNCFLKPFYYGFQRIGIKINLSIQIMYQTYCGKLLTNLDEVKSCLEVMKLEQLHLTDFTFSVKLHFNIKPFPVFSTVPDISYGNEARPIPFFNSSNQDLFPTSRGVYLRDNVYDSNTLPHFIIPNFSGKHSNCLCTETKTVSFQNSFLESKIIVFSFRYL